MTYQTQTCPCCRSRDLEARDALISPFISRYVLGQSPRRTVLLNCKACDALFYADRFDDDEVARLYTDYRGPAYFACRNRYEPWYTRRFNARIGYFEEIERRRLVYQAAVRAAGERTIDSVLDYGGDSGQLMVGGPGCDLNVFDISGVEPADGVTAIASEAALAGRTFDLVLLCHVIEHFSEPLKATQDVARYIRPGGLMFIEVPFERFPISDIPTGRWYGRYLDLIRGAGPLLTALDFLSTAVRIKTRRIPPLGFVKLHEHLNNFDVNSLSALLAAAGLRVLACEVAPSTQVVYAVCERPDACA